MNKSKVISITSATINRACANCGNPVKLPRKYEGRPLEEILISAFCNEQCQKTHTKKHPMTEPHRFINHAKDGT